MMSPFQTTKLWLTDYVGLAKDAMHIYVGLTVFLLTALIFRLPLRDWRPIAAVFLVAAAGEIWDLYERVTYDLAEPSWASNWHDLWNTMFWPTVLFVLARSPRLLKR
jgi:cell shape-determining protein MreD